MITCALVRARWVHTCNYDHVKHRRVKMTRLRQRVAERLKGAQNTAALLTTFNEIDMSSLMEMRSTYKVGSVLLVS